MINEYEIKSEEVLNILEKYREKLKIERYHLGLEENWKKRYVLKIIFKCDFKKYDFENIHECHLTIDFTEQENIVKLGNWVSGSGIVFKNVNKLKLLIEMIEELQKIEYMKLDEFKQYVAMKEEQKKLEEQKKNLEEELLKKKEEIEKKLVELERGKE